ncbi:flagellar hook protein FlgE [Vallitalea okinawensis]|uniref:flagellar hook protein FlgE n=1 Tax=Vallitalea okinawensis TaxID=2078660 RepID=UPI000CFDE9BF|nr:flagellar hook protein FlgE [Vallitalea okinawensis]
MMRSMYAGVSGLRVHQTQMDVIGNNIANVNTVGFKSERATFSDMYYQTLQGASASNPETESGGTNPMQIGLGVSINSIDTLMTEGAAQRTDNPLDVKIEGDGFFVVGDASGTYFTRAGVFQVDSAGYLTTPDGMTLQGWPVDEDGKIVQGQVDPLQIYSPDQAYSEPVGTTKATVYGNIEENDERLDSGNTTGYVFTTSFYDEMGYKYTMEYSLAKESSGPGSNPGEVSLNLEKLKDSDGNIIVDFENSPPASIQMMQGVNSLGTDTVIFFDTTTGKFSGIGDDSATVTDSISIANLDVVKDSLPNDLIIDFSSMTMYAGQSNVESSRGDSQGFGAGREAGTLSSFTIGADGIVTGKYSNGETKSLGQIAIATFSNPAGLQKVGSNLFEATPNSGDFDGIGDDITSTGGALTSGVLEMSNVDLSKEFTDMIVTQRGYQANSRIITVSDEMLQELVGLVR